MNKKTIFSIAIILILILSVIFPIKSFANEEIITDLGTIDLASIAPGIGDAPKTLNYETDKYSVEAKWYLATSDHEPFSYDEVAPITKFEENQNYTCLLTITPKTGYKFDQTPDVPVPAVDFDWGGALLGIYYGYRINPDGTENIAMLTQPVKKNTVTINPVEGLTITPEGKTTVLAGQNFKVDVKAKEGYLITSIDFFEKDDQGNEYSLNILSYPEEEYSFERYISEDAEIIIKSARLLDKIEISGVTTPKEGETPDISKLNVPESASYTIKNAKWIELTRTGPNENFEKFKANERYGLDVTVTLKDPTMFVDPMLTSIEINGSEAKNTYCQSIDDAGNVLINIEYKVLEISKDTQNQTFDISKDKTLSFNIQSWMDSVKVLVNGKLLDDKQVSIVTTDEETIATLSEEYLKNLEQGEYSIILKTPYTEIAETTFTVEDSSKPVQKPDLDLEQPEKRPLDEEPKAGNLDIINYVVFIAIISALGIIRLQKKKTS